MTTQEPAPRLYTGLDPSPVEFDTQYYVGPLGGMRPLPGTESDVAAPLAVIGGTHTSLTGAFTRDRFGYKRSWTWTYPMLTPRQAQHVEALQANLVPGPLFLIDPRRPNRLPEQIATGGSLLRSPTNFIPSNSSLCVWRPLSYPAATPATLPAAGLLRGCIEWQLLSSGTSSFELGGYASDGRHNVPVMPGEVLEMSMWAAGPPAAALSGVVTVFDAAGNTLSTVTLSPVTMSLTTWQVAAIGFTCPAGAAYVRVVPSVASTQTGSLFVTALQVARYQSTVVSGLSMLCDEDDYGGWWLGGGATQVIPDVGATSYVVRPPGLQATALTLIER